MTATTLSSWAKAIRRTLELAGVDAEALFAQAGLNLAALDDPNARYPVDRTAALWRLAVQATGNPALGLDVARQVTPTTFHALGYSQVASGTLKEAFERTLRYFRIVTDAGELSFFRQADRYCFQTRVERGPSGPALEGVDAFQAVLARMVRGLAGRAADPLAVELVRPRPEDTEPYERVFRVLPAFGADANRLWYAAELIERPLEGANPELARANDRVVVEYLARLERSQLSHRVRKLIIEALPEGVPTAEQIAGRVHCSPRSLQRRLAQEGHSFRGLLEESREELARSYLADGRHTVSEVTFLLGFSDVSAFSRAFRRWTGVAPSAYRGGS